MSTSSTLGESNDHGGDLNCFQLDMHFFFFALKIREASQMTWCLIVEPFALCPSAKITILTEHLGQHFHELIEAVHNSKKQQGFLKKTSNSFSILSHFDVEPTASF